MSRRWTLYGVMMVIIMAGGLYQLKHVVETRDQIVQKLQQNHLADQRAIRVLKAEWAYLNSPVYLQDLAGKHLQLRPTAPSQIVRSPGVIPLRVGLSARIVPRAAPRAAPRATPQIAPRIAPWSAHRYPAPRAKPRQAKARVQTRVGALIVRFERAISRGNEGGGP